MKTATYIVGDDWEGIYIDGKLIEEGHNISPKNLLKKLGYVVETFEPDYDWLDGEGYLPEDLKDVKLAEVHSTPYKLGYKQYHDNITIDENPFPDGSDESLQWVEGWLEAEHEDVLWRNAMENRGDYE